MHVAAPTDTTPTPAPTPAAPDDGLNPNDFITLLVAQLKDQDPTNPLDPTQFVGQLVQFNSLEQLININQDLTPATTTTSSSSTSAVSGTAAASSSTAAGGANSNQNSVQI